MINQYITLKYNVVFYAYKLTFYNIHIPTLLVCPFDKVCGVRYQDPNPDPKLRSSVNPRDAGRGYFYGRRVLPNGLLTCC